MNIKSLKEAIKGLPDETEVVLVGWDHKLGGDIKKTTHQCCNFEHQEKVGEFWLSLEGFDYNMYHGALRQAEGIVVTV